MSTVRQLAKGVTFSWADKLSSIIAGFVMAPFLVRHLGVAGYGVWVLIQSTMVYAYFLDLGLRTTVIRFVAHDYAQGNHAEVSRVVSATLWIRLWTAALVVLVTGGLALLLPRVFTIPTDYVLTGRLALLLVGVTFAATLVFSVFAATLLAIGAFDLVSGAEMTQTIVQTVGLFPVVALGYGIVGMATWSFAAALVVNIILVVACLRKYPQLSLTIMRIPERDLLKKLWSVGAHVLGFNAADLLISYTDNLVVGAFVSAASVGYYGVAGKMVQYLRSVAISIFKYFTPLASSFAARKQHDRLERMQIQGTQLVLLIVLPIAVTLFFRGGTFLGLWIGSEFQRNGTLVLQLLVGASALALSNAGATGLAIALGKQHWLTIAMATEGVANLALSVYLARTMGLAGVALGTTIPSVIMQSLVWPQFTCRLIQVSWARFAREVWLRPALSMAPFGLATYLAEVHWKAGNLFVFSGQTIVLLPIAVLGTAAVFYREVPVAWQYMTKRRQASAPQSNSSTATPS